MAENFIHRSIDYRPRGDGHPQSAFFPCSIIHISCLHPYKYNSHSNTQITKKNEVSESLRFFRYVDLLEVSRVNHEIALCMLAYRADLRCLLANHYMATV